MRGDILLQTKPRSWLRFSQPLEIVETRALDEVVAKLRAVEAVVAQGRYAVGFLAYEAAPAFDRVSRVRPPGGVPLLWFGLYDRVERLDKTEQIDRRSETERPSYSIGTWASSVDWPTYEKAIARIKDHIARGDTYQVNYTYRLRAPFDGEAWPFFFDLVRKQPAGYAAYLDLGSHCLCSISPELFFKRSGHTLTTKPMKGTAARGRTLSEDRAQMTWLHQSEKNRAENVMIVDMIRNDLGRVADTASVHVSSLFEVERYPTVLQMTSTVTAQTGASLVDIMMALFPCASITGAPKVRTMELIAELETTPRGVYTGSIGYVEPNGDAQFNVAIRTVTIDQTTHTAEYGVGGGIVWDSGAADEWRECEIKTRVLTQPPGGFDLIESILWTPADGFWLLDLHWQRLTDSAEYFNIPIDLSALNVQLAQLREAWPPVPHKVRINISQSGTVTISAAPVQPLPQPMHITLAAAPVDSRDIFLYHKTTRRDGYEAARAQRPGFDDVILWNERGELTESTIANLVVELSGGRYTPPIECGLLGGTFRRRLLDQNLIRERVILKEELLIAERVWLINSVRGWLECQVAINNEQ